MLFRSLDAGRELLGLDQIGSHDLFGALEDVRTEILNQLVFRGPTALRERIPLHPPFGHVGLVRPALQLAIPPDYRWARQPADHPHRLAVGEAGLADPHLQTREGGGRLSFDIEFPETGGLPLVNGRPLPFQQFIR